MQVTVAIVGAVTLVSVLFLSSEGKTEGLVAYTILDDAIPTPLTKTVGDADRGRAIFLDRENAHCLLCHAVMSLDEPFQGTIAPDLTEIGDRLDAGQLRLRIVDPTLLQDDTPMPAYYRVDDLRQVASAYRGRPVLTAQEVEDVVAYLMTLRAEE